jgi:glucose-1-phosphate cytidylyltransferase
MKVVIFAGGYGSRISEESALRPKPMIEIGGRPMLWHIMKIYTAHGFTDFIILLGYKGHAIKEYFFHYGIHSSDVTFDFASGETKIHNSVAEKWRVTLVDTGEATMTAGRLKRVQSYLDPNLPFLLTYGDAVSDVDVKASVEAHRRSDALVTLTAVQPSGRFGHLAIDGDRVTGFEEKPKTDGTWINGGFFVVSPKALDYVEGDSSVWEGDCLPRIATEGKLGAYHHSGYWQCMDTMRDKALLEDVWATGQAPWKQW